MFSQVRVEARAQLSQLLNSSHEGSNKIIRVTRGSREKDSREIVFSVITETHLSFLTFDRADGESCRDVPSDRNYYKSLQVFILTETSTRNIVSTMRIKVSFCGVC